MSEQNSTNVMNGNNGNKATDIDLDREVIRCKTCGLVQYRTRTGNCRRCLRGSIDGGRGPAYGSARHARSQEEP